MLLKLDMFVTNRDISHVNLWFTSYKKDLSPAGLGTNTDKP